MNHATRTKVAAVALVSALGLGTLTYALRAAPTVQKIMARLRASGARPVESTSPAVSAIAQNAFLVTGSTGVDQGATLASASSGTFTGKRTYAYYGYIRLQAIMKSGSLSDIKIVEYPSDNGRSRYINSIAIPYLIQEAVDAQSWNVDLISGATFTSEAFVQSLRDALRQAGK
jgi:uncharacterized protein with FMN-binding domain